MLTLRFYEELNDFLTPDRRKQTFQLTYELPRSVKDLIESLGVPHVEVDLILINGESVDFEHPVKDGDFISVYPVFEALDITTATRLRPAPMRESRFIADVHLKTLVRKLRMLGFDTLYDAAWDDPDLVRIAEAQNRILLTRDIGLLKRGELSRGLFIRSQDPGEQLTELIRRLDLKSQIRPLSRCIRCNGLLTPILIRNIPDIEASIPPDIRTSQTSVSRCSDCGRYYWRGSHYDRMLEQIRNIRA